MANTQKPYTYQRRRPELTPCYRIVQDHLNTFIADREREGHPLPRYVMKEFEAFLECGVPAYGCLRLVCKSCRQEKVVAYSCKKRGFCPSCCAKRQAEAATHLVEHVLPLAPYRQFVISFPIPMRYWLHSNKKLFAKVYRIIIKEIHRYYKTKALAKDIKDPKPGAISFTQLAGSALNLNPHLHILFCDGVFSGKGDAIRFRNLDAITDQEVEKLLIAISGKVVKHLKNRGYLNPDGELVAHPLADTLFKDHESLAMATASSIVGKIAFGPNAGKKVTKIGSGFGYYEEIPLAKGHRCFSINGFSLHANTSTNALARHRLSNLVEYISRGPLSNERLEITQSGNVKLKLKTGYSDGTSHLLFTPTEFIEKLSAIIPPPKSHLVKWSGVFAPNSPHRKNITLKPDIKKGFAFKENCTDDNPIKNYSWSKMLAKVFKIDVTKCEHCNGDMAVMAALIDRSEVVRYLKHVGIEHEAPTRAPPRHKEEPLDFGPEYYEDEPVITLDR